MVCLIVEGDQTTIETVKEKVKNNIPVVVCAGTGSNRVYEYGKARHAADLIAYAYNHTDEHGSITKEVRIELQRNIHQDTVSVVFWCLLNTSNGKAIWNSSF